MVGECIWLFERKLRLRLFLLSTRDGDVFVSSTDTATTVQLVATSTVEEISFIDEHRFAFNTVADELHIASWPVTTSTIIQTFGVENIRRVSPTKTIFYSLKVTTSSVTYIKSTSTSQVDEFTQLEVNGQAYLVTMRSLSMGSASIGTNAQTQI